LSLIIREQHAINSSCQSITLPQIKVLTFFEDFQGLSRKTGCGRSCQWRNEAKI